MSDHVIVSFLYPKAWFTKNDCPLRQTICLRNNTNAGLRALFRYLVLKSLKLSKLYGFFYIYIYFVKVCEDTFLLSKINHGNLTRVNVLPWGMFS